jgi:hypothetical protein
MKVYVNDRPFDLLPGTAVRHALIAAGLYDNVTGSKLVYDQWGNEVGLGGAVCEGMRIYVRSASGESRSE